MSIQRVEKLQQRWRNSGALTAIEKSLDQIGFTDQYIQQLSRSQVARKPKVIKDSTWGMIEVDPSCLLLLDSPLLQRMRGIRQLGFSYLTYPSAEHTRFVHSLGMFCVVSRFLDIIKHRDDASSTPSAPYTVWKPSPDYVRWLSHAAILHDIGHMPFSHVTEQILQADSLLFRCGAETVEEFVFAAEETLERSPKLAEALSIAIILTDRFQAFYSYVSPGSTRTDILRIAALIVGLEPDQGMVGLSTLISGTSIDADKIDYINRDASACGIPVGIDVSRLFMRSSFLDVKPAELQRLRSLKDPPASNEIIFVVNASGLDSIEEIGQARTLLYHRVYLHQTTRNAERMLGMAFQSAAHATAPLLNALQIWPLDDLALLNTLAASQDTSAAALGMRLKTRQLPKRACVFGRSYARMAVPVESIFPSMKPEAAKSLSKQIVGTALEGLRTKQLFGEEQRTLEFQIQKEAAELAARLSDSNLDIPLGEPEVVSVLPMPNVEPNRSDCIVLENEQLSSTAASSVSDEQMEASDIIKSTGYVLTEPQWKEIVFIAARTVLYRRDISDAEVTLTPYPGHDRTVKMRRRLFLDSSDVTRRIRFDQDRLAEVMRAANRVGYFNTAPRLAPLDIDPAIVQKIQSALRGFNGQGGWSVSINSVRAFLEQFPPDLRDAMANLVSGIEVLSRVDLSSLISGGIVGIDKAGTNGFVVGLSPDSGSSVRTQLEQELKDALATRGWEFKKTIRDVFSSAKPGDHLVLCDDNVTSGSQALCQFMAWLGVPEAEWSDRQMGERGIEKTKLAERDIELLKQLKIWIVTAVGTEKGKELLKDRLPKMGLSQYQDVVYGKVAKQAGAALGALEAFLTDVGSSLICWNRFGKESLTELSTEQISECRRDSLGYDGAKGIYCTPMNVPVGTLTALWAPGIHKGEPWMPLILRRGYIDNLVLS
jgi:deoxynucleoside triphosphate triphosphohydrolase SAMHD1